MLADLYGLLEDRLFRAPSTDLLFNPYNGVDPAWDREDADLIRRDNLRRYLESFADSPEVLIVGEAPGPRGCRFSGVPFTDEALLLSGSLPFSGRQTSRGADPRREYSSMAMWQALRMCHPRFLLWNSVPLHPHQPSEPLSIRTPKGSELREWSWLLGEIEAMLRPELVVALGRRAEEALDQAGVRCVYLRHPSRGGLRAFREGARSLLERFGL